MGSLPRNSPGSVVAPRAYFSPREPVCARPSRAPAPGAREGKGRRLLRRALQGRVPTAPRSRSRACGRLGPWSDFVQEKEAGPTRIRRCGRKVRFGPISSRLWVPFLGLLSVEGGAGQHRVPPGSRGHKHTFSWVGTANFPRPDETPRSGLALGLSPNTLRQVGTILEERLVPGGVVKLLERVVCQIV